MALDANEALLLRLMRQHGTRDAVADGVRVGHGGAELAVQMDAPPAVQLDAHICQTEAPMCCICGEGLGGWKAVRCSKCVDGLLCSECSSQLVARHDSKCPVCRQSMAVLRIRIGLDRFSHLSSEVWAATWLGFLCIGPGLAGEGPKAQFISAMACLLTGVVMCILSCIAMAGLAREIMEQIDPQITVPPIPPIVRCSALICIPPLALSQARYWA